jgi:hypothetical protein
LLGGAVGGGVEVGGAVGRLVGGNVGAGDGDAVGGGVGPFVGGEVGVAVGEIVGVDVGCCVGTGGTVIDGSVVALQTVPVWGGLVKVGTVWAKAVTVELKVKPLHASTVMTSVTLTDCPTVSDVVAPNRFVPCCPTIAVTYSLGMACTFVALYVKVKGTLAQFARLIRLLN